MWLPFPEPFGDDKEMLRKAFEKGKKACEDIKREIFKKRSTTLTLTSSLKQYFSPIFWSERRTTARLCTMTSSEWKSQRKFWLKGSAAFDAMLTPLRETHKSKFWNTCTTETYWRSTKQRSKRCESYYSAEWKPQSFHSVKKLTANIPRTSNRRQEKPK